MKFKVGDRVKIVCDAESVKKKKELKGVVATITDNTRYAGYTGDYKYSLEEDSQWLWRDSELELVETAAGGEEMKELKWAEGTRPKIERIVLSKPVITDFEIKFDVRAVVTDTTDEAIANAVIQEAIADGVAELYLLDREFVIDALREKIEREEGEE